MADTGFLFPGTAVGDRTITGSDVNFGNPDNIKIDDTLVASAFLSNAGDTSAGLAGSNFDFSSIPAGSTIDGIEIKVGDYFAGSGTWAWDVIRLILADDTDGSENKNADLTPLDATERTEETGGASDLWSESISRDNVTDADWGFFLGTRLASGFFAASDVDFMQMKVFYTASVPLQSQVWM